MNLQNINKRQKYRNMAQSTPQAYLEKIKELKALQDMQTKNFEMLGFGGDGKHTNDEVLDIPFYTLPNNQKVILNPALNSDLLATDAVVTTDGVKTVLPSYDDYSIVKKISDIDWLSITLPARVFDDGVTKYINDQDKENALVRNAGKVLIDLIGFGVSHANATGRNFYQSSYTLEHNAGLICIGGQNDTIMVVINGTGCSYGKDGWKVHLHAWLSLYAPMAKITRVDIAYDLIDTEFDIYWFDKQDDLGRFTRYSRKPKVEKRGNWKRPNGKGLTLYIGSRDSAKFCRIYEKGKQLGDPNSNWIRVEVEVKASTVFIPFDVLLEPEKFFIACYPCFADFVDLVTPRKFEVVQKDALITFKNAIEITKNQFGRYLYAFREIYQDDKMLLDILTDIDNKSYPERLDVLTIPPMSH